MRPLAFGAREFQPRLLPTLFVGIAVACLASLGHWQWHRAAEKRALAAAFAAGDAAPVPLPDADAPRARYARVAVTGRYLADRQVLLDNLTHAGVAGYHVLTPLETAGGTVVLIDRGWLPGGPTRDRLPDVAVAGAERTVTGRLDELPRAGIRLDAPAETGWPRRFSYPTSAMLEAALGRRLYPGVLLLDATAADGYARDWQPPGPTPERHLGYALQWYALALTLVILYVALHLKPRETSAS